MSKRGTKTATGSVSAPKNPMHYNVFISLKGESKVYSFSVVGYAAAQAFISSFDDPSDLLETDMEADMPSFLAQNYPSAALRLPTVRCEAEERLQSEREALEAALERRLSTDLRSLKIPTDGLPKTLGKLSACL